MYTDMLPRCSKCGRVLESSMTGRLARCRCGRPDRRWLRYHTDEAYRKRRIALSSDWYYRSRTKGASHASQAIQQAEPLPDLRRV